MGANLFRAFVMMSVTLRRNVVAILALLVVTNGAQAGDAVVPPWDWATASPESQRMAAARLEAAWANLKNRHTTAFPETLAKPVAPSGRTGKASGTQRSTPAPVAQGMEVPLAL